jgi:hypothetical protein
MDTPPRLTKQGVRDLDFGWKKHRDPNPAPDTLPLPLHPELNKAPELEPAPSPLPPHAKAEPVAGASVEVIDGKAAWTVPASVPRAAPRGVG